MSPGNRPADPTVTVAPPPGAGPDVWFEAAGRLGLGHELDARVLERVVGLRRDRLLAGPGP
jgi:hypothetical protein